MLFCVLADKSELPMLCLMHVFSFKMMMVGRSWMGVLAAAARKHATPAPRMLKFATFANDDDDDDVIKN